MYLDSSSTLWRLLCQEAFSLHLSRPLLSAKEWEYLKIHLALCWPGAAPRSEGIILQRWLRSLPPHMESSSTSRPAPWHRISMTKQFKKPPSIKLFYQPAVHVVQSLSTSMQSPLRRCSQPFRRILKRVWKDRLPPVHLGDVAAVDNHWQQAVLETIQLNRDNCVNVKWTRLEVL